MAAVLLMGVVIAAVAGGQNPTSQEPLVRVNVDLVQVDVVVTDAQGNHVTDLKPEELEIRESGKLQPITNFSFLNGRNGDIGSATAIGAAARTVAAARIAPGQANRTIAVVVDDFGISDQSFAAIHTALEKFVDQQVGPGDLIAILTTSGRLGALERLSGDKRLLRAAVDKFRSLPSHRPGVGDDDFTCVWYNHKRSGATFGIQDEDVWLGGAMCSSCPKELDPQAELANDHRSAYYGILSLSALKRVVDGLRELPGRKSILLFTEGLPVIRAQGYGETNSQVTEGYEGFVNHANRSGVTVNTIDPRGLVASFDTVERGHSAEDPCYDARVTELAISQLQLGDIAKRTGGISIVNNNDILGSIARVVNDQVGYYLIGYKPPETEKKGPGFRKITIRATRPGVKVRFHSSLYEQEPYQAAAEGGVKRLVAAVTSPFAIPNVRIRFASRYWDAGPDAGLVLDTILEMDARDLTFRAASGGRREAEFDVLALIYGSASKPLDTLEKSYTVSLTEAAYERALREGLVQPLRLRLKQAGAYQIRGAVRDRESGRVGSASEFVEVPDLARGKLAVSGIALSGEGAATPARLRFRPGERVYYAYQVLNGSMNMQVRVTLYHDGQALGTSAPMTIDPTGQADARRLVVSKDFRLGKQLKPGDYTLQVTVVDQNAQEKRATASQTADFEVIEEPSTSLRQSERQQRSA